MGMEIEVPPEIRVTTKIVKEHTLKYCIRFMVTVGLLVQENRHDNVVTLTVTIPPDSKDKHGERLKMMNAGTTKTMPKVRKKN